MTDEFAPETADVPTGDITTVPEDQVIANADISDDSNGDGTVSALELVRGLGPSQEQLDAAPYTSHPELPEALVRAAQGEQVVTSLPLELQGGDSLNPQNNTPQDNPGS